MDNEFIISQLDDSLFVFDQTIVDQTSSIQITLNLKIILNNDGVNKTIKKTANLTT